MVRKRHCRLWPWFTDSMLSVGIWWGDFGTNIVCNVQYGFVGWLKYLKKIKLLFGTNDRHSKTTCRVQNSGRYLQGQGYRATLLYVWYFGEHTSVQPISFFNEFKPLVCFTYKHNLYVGLLCHNYRSTVKIRIRSGELYFKKTPIRVCYKKPPCHWWRRVIQENAAPSPFINDFEPIIKKRILNLTASKLVTKITK